jgi:molybdate-binding protein/DNA-binding XRE family transcriptional regulator
LDQTEAAQRAGITRQTLSSIEAGRMTPNVYMALRLARVFRCRVEDLFSIAAPQTLSVMTARSLPVSTRVVVARIGTKWTAHAVPVRPLLFAQSADGIVLASDAKRAEIELHEPIDVLERTLLVVGCAPALGILADRARNADLRVRWLSRSSLASLSALAKGLTHIAGVHLVDEEGAQNLPFIEKALGNEGYRVLTLAHWQEGFLLQNRNPRGIRTAHDVLRPDVRIVRREATAASQIVFEREVRAAGGIVKPVMAKALKASSHDEVAHLISIGIADVGFGTLSAAIAYKLDFLPVIEERFDLVFREQFLSDSRIDRFGEVLSSLAFRRDLQAVGGYDTTHTGSLVDTRPSSRRRAGKN